MLLCNGMLHRRIWKRVRRFILRTALDVRRRVCYLRVVFKPERNAHMTTTTHTPTPWRTIPPTDTCMVHRIFGGTRYIGLVGNSDNHDHADAANAAHIVACVNAHAALVAALRAIAALSNAPTRHVDDYGGDIARTALRDAGIAESGVAE